MWLDFDVRENSRWTFFFFDTKSKNSDGTHSLQRIHRWASDAVLHFSKSVFMKKRQTLLALVTGGSTQCSSSSIINECVNYMNVWYWHLHHHEGVAHETSRSSNMTGMNTPSCWVGRLRSHEGKSYSMNPVVCCYCYTSEPVQNGFMLMRPYVPTNTMKLKLCVMTNGA